MTQRWLRFWVGVIVIAIALPLLPSLRFPSPLFSPLAVTHPVAAGAALAQLSPLEAQQQQADEQFYNRDYRNAEASYQQVLAWLTTNDPDSDAIAEIRHNLARIYLLTHRSREALPLLEQLNAAGWTGSGLGNNLALAYFHTGNYPAAERVLNRVLADWDAIRAGDDLGDSDRITLFEQQAHSYALMQRVLVAQGKTDAALAMAERGRARALVTQLGQTGQAEMSDQPLTVPAIRAVAREQNTTLVVYAALGDGQRILGNAVDIETDLFTWVIPPQGPIQFQQTPLSSFWDPGAVRSAAAAAASPLEALVASTRQALRVSSRGLGIVPSDRRVTDDLPPSNPLPLQSLYQILIAPIAATLPTDPEALVTLIPQGPLFLVPFAALPDPNGQVLMASHTLALAPSVQALALATEAQPPRPGGLVVGNPVEMPTLPLQEQPANLPPLPGAEREAEAIAQILDTSPLTRQAATEAAVVAQMPRSPIIHLATHGLLNIDSRLTEFGLPTAVDAPTATDANVFVNPGAVIVGGNVTVGGTDAAVTLARERVVRFSPPGVIALAPGDGEDGWLTAEEISALDLQADLVVLSACDTGRGRITGDGVVGLSRAFLVAGADTVVVSLWQVPDDATAALMVAFYQQLATTRNKAQALRLAMLATQNQYPDPRNWSAFVLVGEAT
jgi:CHAT domain-containing protein/tetratricopeptide (TPR) repeat protein